MTKNIKKLLSNYSQHLEFSDDSITEVTQVGLFGSQVLHLAAFRGKLQDIEVFLECGADINAKGDLGLTPLHYAVLGGQSAAVQLLMTKNASRTIENEFAETPLQMARLMSNPEITEILREGGLYEIVSSDDGVIAAQRWAEFKNIQELNFADT